MVYHFADGKTKQCSLAGDTSAIHTKAFKTHIPRGIYPKVNTSKDINVELATKMHSTELFEMANNDDIINAISQKKMTKLLLSGNRTS